MGMAITPDIDDEQDDEIEYIESVVVQGKCLALGSDGLMYLNGEHISYNGVERFLGHTRNTLKRRLDTGHALCKAILPTTHEYWTQDAKVRGAERGVEKCRKNLSLGGIGLVGDRAPLHGIERLYCDLLRMPL